MHGRPLSFFAFLGLVGLAGVVVNDSIVLIDFVNKLRREGVPTLEALLGAGKTRLRPILMTSTTTVGGLISVAYGIGGGGPVFKAHGFSHGLGTFVFYNSHPHCYSLYLCYSGGYFSKGL